MFCWNWIDVGSVILVSIVVVFVLVVCVVVRLLNVVFKVILCLVNDFCMVVLFMVCGCVCSRVVMLYFGGG